jgi:glyoxylase-like metal-dependent hydrolase (beta-lactamase superfamily II)
MTADQQFIVVQIPAGPIETNAFLVIDPATREALIFDAPPDVVDRLAQAVEQHSARPVALVITHTHWDHIGDVAVVAERFSIPVLVHEIERKRIENPSGGPEPIAPASVARTLGDGDDVMLAARRFSVMHTPGHSPGQISLYNADARALFGGDTLFPDGYGTVEIPGASQEDTVATIRRLLELPDDVTVYPGHGRTTTIGRERHWMTRVAETGQLL